MSYRPRGKGFQLDITHSGSRYRTQICGDKSDAIIAEQLCIKYLREGKQWEDIEKLLDTSKRERTVGAIFNKIKHTYNDKHGLQTTSNVVKLLGDNFKIEDINEDVVDSLISQWKDLGNSNATCNRKLAGLSKLLSYAKKRRLIKHKPEIEWLKEGLGRMRYIKPDEEKRLINILKSLSHYDLADMVQVACDTGFRKSELKRINIEKDLDGNRLTCNATKNDLIRTITLTERSLKILKRRSNLPFADITDDYLRAAWNRAKIKMGLENDHQFTFHCTRHTCASRLVQSNVPIQVVQQWLGHKTIKMTLRYSHLAPHNFEEAGKALDVINQCDPGRDLAAIER